LRCRCIGQPCAQVIFATGSIPDEEPGPNVYFIDLPAALRLTGAQNLDVRIAREKLAEAKADNQSALLPFFPWLSAGIVYRSHDGRIQDTSGEILDVNKQSYAPGGALVSQLDLGDAIYKKLAARQLQQAADYGHEAQRQDSIGGSPRLF
jgi:outer membrane protein TolC